jgi:hypothetical protein
MVFAGVGGAKRLTHSLIRMLKTMSTVQKFIIRFICDGLCSSPNSTEQISTRATPPVTSGNDMSHVFFFVTYTTTFLLKQSQSCMMR